MQRRNVDLPEPDGPEQAHHLAAAATSSVMPFSTSRRPKRLCTPSALTIGSALIGRAPSLGRRGVADRAGSRRSRCSGVGGCVARRAAAEAALDVVLADREHRRDDQVPDARHDQQRDRACS